MVNEYEAAEATLKKIGALSAIVIPGFVSSEWPTLEAAVYAKIRLEGLGLVGCKVVKVPGSDSNHFTSWDQE